MEKIQMPTVCPECKSTDVCELSNHVYQTLHYKFVAQVNDYEKAWDDSEDIGGSYLQCDSCGHIYNDEIYDAWLEHV